MRFSRKKIAKVILKNRPLFYSILARYVDGNNIDDLIHDVYIKCCDNFDKEFETEHHLINWIAKICKNEAYTFASKYQRMIPTDDPFIFDSGCELSYEDDLIFNEIVDSILMNFSERVRNAIKCYVFEHYTIKEICKIHNITRETFKYWKNKFVERIKKIY